MSRNGPTGIDLQGKVALVTGAGSGLGAATARAFAREGCSVVCLDINADAAASVARKIAAADVEALPLGCDVSDADAAAHAVGHHTLAVEESVGRPVGSGHRREPARAVPLLPPGLPDHEAAGGGHIVNVASTAATRAWANAAAYHASKWGLIGFSRGLGVEGRPHGIRVTTVIPGGMRTHFFDRFIEQGIPMPDEANLQDPAVVAATIVFAVTIPPESALQEVIVTPVTETSWP